MEGKQTVFKSSSSFKALKKKKNLTRKQNARKKCQQPDGAAILWIVRVLFA